MKLDARKGHLIIALTRKLRGYEGKQRDVVFLRGETQEQEAEEPAVLLTLAEHTCMLVHHKSEADLVPSIMEGKMAGELGFLQALRDI